jgi:hypothetical protein
MAEKTHSAPGEHPQHAPAEGNLRAAAAHLETGARQAINESGLNTEGPSLATAVAIGVGVAILEPELIPGVLIGAGAMLAPKVIPALGGALRPLVKGMVKAGYSAGMAVREMVAEAGEHVEDIVAEARAEHESGNGHGAGKHPSAAGGSRRERRPNRPSPAANR